MADVLIQQIETKSLKSQSLARHLFRCLILAVAISSNSTVRADPASEAATRPFPTPLSVGVPVNWKPKTTYTQDLRVTTAGAIIEDVRLVNADLKISAPNVTIRRVEILGGTIDTGCRNGIVLQSITIAKNVGQVTRDTDPPAIGPGGYTARRVKIDGLPEGFRVGGLPDGCGRVIIQNSFIRIVSPDVCSDWHGDGIQGYGGPPVTIRNVTVIFMERGGCGGTAPFFYPKDQGNVSVTIDRLLVEGGGYSFRLGMPGSVTGLRIVDHEWGYGPMDVNCPVITNWEAAVVSIDGNYQPMGNGSPLPCHGSGGA